MKMTKVTITIDSDYDVESIRELVKEAHRELTYRNLVEEVSVTLPSLCLLVGLLNSRPPHLVTTKIRGGEKV